MTADKVVRVKNNIDTPDQGKNLEQPEKKNILPNNGVDDDSSSDEEPLFQTRIKQEVGHYAYQGMFACPYCDIIFPDTLMYLTHRNMHCYDDPFKCCLCLVKKGVRVRTLS